MNQKMVDSDIHAVMVAFAIPYADAVDMIKNGINLEYIKTGFKSEIERDANSLMNEHRQKVSNIINEEFS